MTDWFIRLVGEELDLKILSSIFTSKELSISKKEDGFYLYNKDYCNIKNSDDVLKEAENLIIIINGIAKSSQYNFKPVKTASVMFYDKNGRKNVFLNISDHIEFRAIVSATAHIIGKDGKEKQTTVENRIQQWLEIANKNVKVNRALKFIGSKDLEWNELYKIYEIIEKDIGKDIEKLASKSLIKNFAHTANSYGAIGDKARHGDETTLPPTNPMKFEEAKILIIKILTKWINSKKI